MGRKSATVHQKTWQHRRMTPTEAMRALCGKHLECSVVRSWRIHATIAETVSCNNTNQQQTQQTSSTDPSYYTRAVPNSRFYYSAE